MALTVDPLTHVISVPKADLTLVQTIPTEIRELDLDTFRRELKAWEDDALGMAHLKTHLHNTEVSLGGVTYARVIEILDPYSITFEDGQYAVNLTGANSNVSDKVNVNQVSVRSANSAGLQIVTVGSGVTAQDKTDIIDGVWNEPIGEHLDSGTTGETLYDIPTADGIADAIWDEPAGDHTDSGSMGDSIIPPSTSAIATEVWAHSDAAFLLKVIKNKKSLIKNGSVWELIIYDDDDTTPIMNKELKDYVGNNITDMAAGELAEELQTSV